MSSQPPVPPASGDQPWQHGQQPPGQQPPGQQPPGQQHPGHQPPPGYGAGGQQGNPYQQGPGGPSPWASAQGEAQGFFKSLFDFSFQNYVTLTFAKIIYGIIIAVAVLGWLFYIIAGFAAHWAAGLGALLLGWIPVLLMIILYRVALEFAVAMIRTAQNTGILVKRER